MKRSCQLLCLAALLFVAAPMASAQGRLYEGPDDPAGDISDIREGFMTGNQVYLYFRNTTELSDWPREDVSKWPNTYEGVKMLDGVALMIGARVFVEKDSIPVTDPAVFHNRTDLDTLFFLETSYREFSETDPTGTVKWGFYPVSGYFNDLGEYPAMSNLPDSWPVRGWPSQGRSLKWKGEWNGRFGRGVTYADLETFFVVNDAQDQEYLGSDDRVKYYPRKGVRIGDIRPEITIQRGLPWGGVGLRVETRGFQWNNPQSRDAIFWEYNVSNISDYDLAEVGFGYWVDNQIGWDGDDEMGFFDTNVDMAYSWDIDGVGRSGLVTGIMGFAYLESPGLPFDSKDNDGDGLLDEKRDNTATAIIGPQAGIADLNKFLAFYNLQPADLRDHWDADEDQDWQDGVDVNGNGTYARNVGTEQKPVWVLEPDEYAGDDVGLDGVGPNELNYNGPDAGECNHRPDFVEGEGCEPNFAATDVSESDMVGLTAFRMMPSDGRGQFQWHYDKAMWELVGSAYLEAFTGQTANLIETFASGPFPLYKGRTERISMSILHSYDPLSGLKSAEHLAPSLYEKKRIVQIIYEGDYRFAQPPVLPKLVATPGDHEIVLTWDDASDKKTREPLLKNINDFEGYKLYRASDVYFSDAELINDGYGNPLYKKPLFQCDLVDGRKGFTNFATINGSGYYLGADNGLVHHYVDKEVENGVTYYYALCAYDYGIPDIGPGIAPSENNIVIELDESEQVRNIGRNVQIVAAHQYAAGYVPPSLAGAVAQTFGSNTVEPEIVSRPHLRDSHTYKVKFGVDTVAYQKDMDFGLVWRNNSISIYDVTRGDSLIYREDKDSYANANFIYDYDLQIWRFNAGKTLTTGLVDGFQLKFNVPVFMAEIDAQNSGWLDDQEWPITITPPQINGLLSQKIAQRFFPYDYDIIFTGNDSAYVAQTNTTTLKNEMSEPLFKKDLLVKQAFPFYVVNRSFADTSGLNEKLELIVHDLNHSGQYEMLDDRVFAGFRFTKGRRRGMWGELAFVIDFLQASAADNLPKPGDVYHLTFKRPWLASDSLQFTVAAAGAMDKGALSQTMEEIDVVPNPYVMTNAMEPALSNPYLNQQRRLMFIHLPARCSVRIFTASGILVDSFEVDNAADNGTAHWNMRTREGLDIAAGVYLYHVQAKATGDERIGKFAVVK